MPPGLDARGAELQDEPPHPRDIRSPRGDDENQGKAPPQVGRLITLHWKPDIRIIRLFVKVPHSKTRSSCLSWRVCTLLPPGIGVQNTISHPKVNDFVLCISSIQIPGGSSVQRGSFTPRAVLIQKWPSPIRQFFPRTNHAICSLYGSHIRINHPIITALLI